MKRIAFLLISAFGGLQLTAAGQYWQQRVDYNIKVSLNDKDHTLKGTLDLDYTNNSPDKLEFIWFHCWPNAYKNDQTALAKQLARDRDGRKEWGDLKEKGFIDSLDFSVNNEKVKWVPDAVNIDIVKLLLPTALAPGEKVHISTPFFVKLPSFISRSGHVDQTYMVTQWYPKPAVYDRKGWHPIPYLDQGEFYSEFGSFDVAITVPAGYVVGATGKMQNTDELNKYKQIGIFNDHRSRNAAAKMYSPDPGVASKTLHYLADSVHDFAWFADKEFIIEYDTLALEQSRRVIDVFSYHHYKGNPLWNESISYIKDAVKHYSWYIGEYPYPTVAAVEGPAQQSSGGMEYPMITLITSPKADVEVLDGTIAHEVGHNWFYGVLGSNERDHPWMDEGMNSYFQFIYEAEKYKANSLFGNSIPSDIRRKPTDEFLDNLYLVFGAIPIEPKIDQPAANYRNMDEYGMGVYLKTAIWLHQEEQEIGKSLIHLAFLNYFTEWKFKHPYPEDVKASFEKTLHRNLDEFFGKLDKKGAL
ncbi:MAG TPA: M1 family metallopeptidase [Chitinophagaceae bacterium]|nr:M1 family metallopeptidase [Chitinophagaceae bacterium]